MRLTQLNWIRSTRLDRLHRVAWESSKQMPPHIAQNLTPGEMKYFETYCAQLDAYTNDFSTYCNLDLTVDLTPPKDLFIEVRIKKDLGQMVLPESGTCLLYTSPSPRDRQKSRMPSSA